jgi:hypothetical protein
MHDEIIRYVISGEVSDRKLTQIKDTLINFLETQMREEGVIPSLDLDPQFTRHYDAEKDVFHFSLSVYGVFVGEERSWQEAGVMNGMTITRSIVPTKSRES